MSLKSRYFLGATAAAGAGGVGAFVYQKKLRDLPRASVKPVDGNAHNLLFILTDQERYWSQLPRDFIDCHCPNRAWLRRQAVDIQNANTTSQLCSLARSPYRCVEKHAATVFRGPAPRCAHVGFGLSGRRQPYRLRRQVALTHMHSVRAGADAAKVQSLVRSYGFDEALLDGEVDGANAGLNANEATARKAADFMRRNQGADKPWMLAVNLVDPHDVMYYTANDAMTQSRVTQFPDESARPPQTALYQDDLGSPVFGTWGPATRSGKPRAVQEFSQTMDEALGHMPYDDPKIAREFQNYYLNCIRDCDKQLGIVLDGLRQSGQLARTIIVFTSDHGEFLGAHGLRGKGSSIYREASEVPLLIVHPDGAKAQRSNGLFSAVDLVPTMLGLAGLDTRAYFEQLPRLAGYDLSALAGRPAETGARDQGGILGYWTALTFLNHENVRRFNAIQQRPPGIRHVAMLSMIRETLQVQRGAMRGLNRPPLVPGVSRP